MNEVEKAVYAEIPRQNLPQKEKAAEALAALLTKKKKVPEKTKVVYGCSNPISPEDSLLGDLAVVAFGVNNECSKEAMTEYLRNKNIQKPDFFLMEKITKNAKTQKRLEI